MEWLDATAALVLEGRTKQGLRRELRLAIGDTAPDSGPHGAFGKTATVLMRVWANPPEAMAGLRDHALQLLPTASQSDRLVIHWSLLLAVYPFYFDLASTIGRLTVLQEELSLREIRQRLAERWGERSTLSTAIQRGVRTMIDLGVLRVVERAGAYARLPAPCAVSATAWLHLVEAILLATEEVALPISRLASHPAAFPFAAPAAASQEIRSSNRFSLSRQGLDVEMVRLRL